MPKLFNLRMDHESISYPKWRLDRMYVMVPANEFIFNWIESFKEFPPAQEVASWSIDKVMKQMASGGRSGN